MKDQDALRKTRKELLRIYATHDVEAFRRFIRENKEGRPNLAKFEDASNFTLSEILYEEKSKSPHLGKLWEEARNHKRMKAIWKGVNKKDYPLAIQKVFRKEGHLPVCNDCCFLQNPHPQSGKACVDMNGVPSDVCCPGFKPLPKTPKNRA